MRNKKKPCHKRVLVIEDDPEQAEALSEALALTGCAIDVALAGVPGVEKARDTHPDIIVCDIRLPDIDGFEVARRIRADPALGNTHLVALSAYAFPQHRRQSEEAGFDAHLVKPPSFEDLERCIGE
jgi:CheY-like chemotaxis protein